MNPTNNDLPRRIPTAPARHPVYGRPNTIVAVTTTIRGPNFQTRSVTDNMLIYCSSPIARMVSGTFTNPCGTITHLAFIPTNTGPGQASQPRLQAPVTNNYPSSDNAHAARISMQNPAKAVESGTMENGTEISSTQTPGMRGCEDQSLIQIQYLAGDRQVPDLQKRETERIKGMETAGKLANGVKTRLVENSGVDDKSKVKHELVTRGEDRGEDDENRVKTELVVGYMGTGENKDGAKLPTQGPCEEGGHGLRRKRGLESCKEEAGAGAETKLRVKPDELDAEGGKAKRVRESGGRLQ